MTKWNPRVLVTLYQQEIILFQYRGQKLTKVIYWQRQTGCFLFIKPLSSDFGHTLLVVYALFILQHLWHCFLLKWLLQGHCNDSWCNKLLFDVAKIQITPANVRYCKQTFLYCLFVGYSHPSESRNVEMSRKGDGWPRLKHVSQSWCIPHHHLEWWRASSIPWLRRPHPTLYAPLAWPVRQRWDIKWHFFFFIFISLLFMTGC